MFLSELRWIHTQYGYRRDWNEWRKNFENHVVKWRGVRWDFEPFQHQQASLSTPNGLPGIKVDSGGNYTDSNGQQWVCDEMDFKRWKYVQRIRKVIWRIALSTSKLLIALWIIIFLQLHAKIKLWKTYIKESFRSNSLRFSYAFRLAIGITVTSFIVDYFNIQEGRWIVYTVNSLIQPFYEKYEEKTKDRIIATVIGVAIISFSFWFCKIYYRKSIINGWSGVFIKLLQYI